MRFRLTHPGGTFTLGRRTRVMGILNVTPDSFSDGGKFLDHDRAVEHGLLLRREGADIIDVGGESTRPGARAVSAKEEIARIVPVIRRLAKKRVLVSVDTSKAAVAREAFRAGARILNDVTALRGDPAMGKTAARADVAVVLMHMKGTPRTMQKNPEYGDVMAEISRFLKRAANRALSKGIKNDKIILDPGIGFGKTPEHNLMILRRLRELRSLGYPLAIGTSRKSFIGHVLNRPVEERLFGTAATVAVSVLKGADLVRVHDVREMRDVAKIADVLK